MTSNMLMWASLLYILSRRKKTVKSNPAPNLKKSREERRNRTFCKWWWTKGTRKLSECGRSHTIHKQFLTWKRMIYYCLKVPNIYSYGSFFSIWTEIWYFAITPHKQHRHYSRLEIQIVESWDKFLIYT